MEVGYMSWYTKEEIEKKFCEYLGAEKVIWLKNGIWQDDAVQVWIVCARMPLIATFLRKVDLPEALEPVISVPPSAVMLLATG